MLDGKRIKDERLKLGLSQQELGDLLGVSKVTICGYENGTKNPKLENFLELIAVLHVSPDYLLGQDISLVNDNGESYGMRFSKEEVEVLRELQKHPSLHRLLCDDPKRGFELIERKLNK